MRGIPGRRLLRGLVDDVLEGPVLVEGGLVLVHPVLVVLRMGGGRGKGERRMWGGGMVAMEGKG